MAVVMKEAVKQKKAKANPVTEQVDTLYDLTAQVKVLEKQIEPLAKVLSETRTALSEIVEKDTKPEDSKVLPGTKADLEFGVLPNVVLSVNLVLGRQLLGEKTFMEIAKINIGDLEKYLTPEEFEKCVIRDRKGTRRIKWLPK
jgi:hypothetical protein